MVKLKKKKPENLEAAIEKKIDLPQRTAFRMIQFIKETLKARK